MDDASPAVMYYNLQENWRNNMVLHSDRSLEDATVLYSLNDPLAKIAFRGRADEETYRRFRLAKRGELAENEPLAIHQASGKRALDFIWVSLEPLIHERVVHLLMSSGITGWSTYPVEVYDREHRLLSNYHGLSILGRCQAMSLDKDHSELLYRETSRGRFPYYKGLYVSFDSWDGSDIFTAADGHTGYIIITERVNDVLRKAEVTNISTEPISEVYVRATDQRSFLKDST